MQACISQKKVEIYYHQKKTRRCIPPAGCPLSPVLKLRSPLSTLLERSMILALQCLNKSWNQIPRNGLWGSVHRAGGLSTSEKSLLKSTYEDNILRGRGWRPPIPPPLHVPAFLLKPCCKISPTSFQASTPFYSIEIQACFYITTPVELCTKFKIRWQKGETSRCSLNFWEILWGGVGGEDGFLSPEDVTSLYSSSLPSCTATITDNIMIDWMNLHIKAFRTRYEFPYWIQ